MKKPYKKVNDVVQSTLPKLKSQPAGPDTMPAGFTSGDVFFNHDTSPAPFTNTPLEEAAPQAPHPILHGKIAKDPPPRATPKPMPKLVPPPPPVIPGQAILPFQSPQHPAVAAPKLVPPLPPVTFPVTPPPGPSPAPAEIEPDATGAPYQYPETEGEEEPRNEGKGEPQEEMPEDDESVPVTTPKPEEAPAEDVPAKPVQPSNPIATTFKYAKGIVELSLTLPEVNFCGSLCVPVEEGHCVMVILLTRQAKTGPSEVKITTDGLRVGDKGQNSPSSLQADVAAITSAAAKLQGDIAKDGPLIEQIIAFLSGANLKIIAPRAKIEAVRGPGGTIIGYFQGESLVQFVVTVALVAEGPVTHYLDLPFPAILGGGVETYLLPSSADIGDFVQYLAAKNAVGWQGQKTRAVRHRILDKQGALGRTLTWGGSAVIAYAFAAGLLGAFFPDLALSLSLLAPAILGAVLAGTGQLWHKAKQDMAAMHLALANRTSWRLVNFARDQVDRTTAQLQGPYKRQFLGEMHPEETLDTIAKLGKTPPPDLASNPRLNEEITAAASYVLGPRAGADAKQLKDALEHAISEVKRKRVGGAAKVVIAVARARVQAILVKAGKVPSKDMTPAMPLDDLFSASIARLKSPIPTGISVPLLDLERDLASGLPVTRERLSKAIAAATSLVEHTTHFWAKGIPDHVKEVPYPKTSVPVVGEDFDNAFG